MDIAQTGQLPLSRRPAKSAALCYFLETTLRLKRLTSTELAGLGMPFDASITPRNIKMENLNQKIQFDIQKLFNFQLKILHVVLKSNTFDKIKC